ncbi:MAG: hypothetical protein ABIG89_05450 [Candidatus Woesearchaeota archaeon]
MDDKQARMLYSAKQLVESSGIPIRDNNAIQMHMVLAEFLQRDPERRDDYIPIQNLFFKGHVLVWYVPRFSVGRNTGPSFQNPYLARFNVLSETDSRETKYNIEGDVLYHRGRNGVVSPLNRELVPPQAALVRDREFYLVRPDSELVKLLYSVRESGHLHDVEESGLLGDVKKSDGCNTLDNIYQAVRSNLHLKYIAILEKAEQAYQQYRGVLSGLERMWDVR